MKIYLNKKNWKQCWNYYFLKKKEKYIKTEFKEKDKIHFIEIMYQKYFKEYLDVLKKSNKDREDNIKHQFYLELALYYCYRLFVAHCEKIVKKIIFDLSTFEKADVSSFQRKVHPIVFPNPYYFSQENNSVLLYSIWGVNYTLTWNPESTSGERQKPMAITKQKPDAEKTIKHRNAERAKNKK